MKETKDIIQNRLAKSARMLRVAKLLGEVGEWDSVANRLYYALFHAVSALALQHEQTTKTHSGMKTLFHERFVKTGLFAQEFGQIYQVLYQNRHEADYGDFALFDETIVAPLLEKTESFLDAIKTKIPNSACTSYK